MIGQVLLHIVGWSLQASILILFLFGLRLLLGRFIRPAWAYALWFLVLLKLTVPWMPDSPISIERIIPASVLLPGVFTPAEHPIQHEQLIHNDEHESIITDGEPIESVGNDAYSRILPGGDEIAANENEQNLAAAATLPVQSLQVLALIWLSGTGWMIVRSVLHYRKLTARLARYAKPVTDSTTNSIIQRTIHRSGITIKVRFVESPDIRSPILVGVVRPTVVLPEGAIHRWSEQSLEFALLHELMHVKRQDIWTGLWFYGLLAVHWFNPLLWVAYRQFRLDQESACDASVLAGQPKHSLHRYGLALLDWAEPSSVQAIGSIVSHKFAGKSSIRRRIEMISRYQKTGWAYATCAALIFSLITLVFLTGAGSPNSSHLAPQDEASSAINWIAPAEGLLSRSFSKVSDRSEAEPYTAIAITNTEGTPVKSAADGIVRYADYSGEYGFRVEIEHDEGWSTAYSHLHAVDVAEGDSVTAGERIGTMGTTGRSTGVHLRFEVMHDHEPIDPLTVIPDPPWTSAETEAEQSEPIFPLQFPIETEFKLISGFGLTHHADDRVSFHAGVDITAPDQPAVLAVAGGRIEVAEYSAEKGNHIVIDHGLGWKSAYFHLANVSVAKDDHVTKGERLGEMGSTGRTTGTHLHFELYRGKHPVDPLDYYEYLDGKMTGKRWGSF